MHNWYYRTGETLHGPFSAAEIRSLAQHGTITQVTRLIGPDGRKMSAGQVRGLMFADGCASLPPPPPLPAPPPPLPPDPAEDEAEQERKWDRRWLILVAPLLGYLVRRLPLLLRQLNEEQKRQLNEEQKEWWDQRFNQRFRAVPPDGVQQDDAES